MNKIGIFYAPMGGSVEKVANMVFDKIGSEKADLVCLQHSSVGDLEKFLQYDKLILGISTVGRDSWDASYKKIGWDNFIPMLDDKDLSNKTVAIFGLGNHILYPDNFVDSLGVLAQQIEKNGAKLVGYVSTDNYDFNDSAAIRNGKFFGVAIDEDNDSDLTENRLNNWLEEIKSDFGF